jgi:hypothetical protein
MIPLEDKLRAAIHATAEEIPADPPPLRLGSPGLSPRRRSWFRPSLAAVRIRPGWGGRNPWLAPLAAAAVVVAVVLGSLAVTGGGTGRATPATPAAPGLVGVPPYYVALTRLGGVFNPGGEIMPDGAIADGAEVRSTATGAVLATIALPQPYEFFGSITAAADDRTFVLSAAEAFGHTQGNRLFVLHIDPGPAASPARHARVSLQPLPASFPASDSTAMALSPDGTSLAAEIGDSLYVFNLVTGTQRRWSLPSSSGYSFGPGTPCLDCHALSWTADGQHIAFICFGASANSAAVGLLDTSSAGTNALAVSKPVALSVADTNMTEHWRGAIITPDGRTVLAGADLATKGGPDGLLKVSTATGKMTAILSIPNTNTNSDQVLYTNATGNVLVVSSYPDSGQMTGLNAGILRADTYTPLPWMFTTVTAAW